MQFLKDIVFGKQVERTDKREIQGFIGLYTLEKLKTAKVPIHEYLDGSKDEFVKKLFTRNPRMFKAGMFQINKTIVDVMSQLNGATRFPYQAYILRLRTTPEETISLALQGRFHEALLDAYEFSTIRKLVQTDTFNLENFYSNDSTLEQLSIKSQHVLQDNPQLEFA